MLIQYLILSAYHRYNMSRTEIGEEGRRFMPQAQDYKYSIDRSPLPTSQMFII